MIAKRIGVYGGSFDPIHVGHLICAQQVMEGQKLDIVLIVPNYISPFKEGSTKTNAEHRLRMCEKAVKNIPKFHVTGIEANKSKPSYTVDTLEKLITLTGDASFSLIIGDDAFLDFPKWKNPDRISELCESIFVMTPTTSNIIIPDNYWSTYKNARSICVTSVGFHSSDIRKLKAQNKSIDFYTPKSVVKYINKKGLYARN